MTTGQTNSRFDLTRPIPLLIIGDGPDLKTGLGRIGHDLAWLFSSMPEFRVGYMGRCGFGRSKFPWQQYNFSEREQWGEHRLEEAWRDLSDGGRHRGIVFTVWDASRLMWLADPVEMPESFQRLVRSGEFERWGYFMVDGAGVNPGQLPLEQAHVMRQFDRALVASKWGKGLAEATGGIRDLDWLPHGLNTESFKPVERELARSLWGVGEKDVVVGCVMSNQQRKHWPTVMEAVARMKGKGHGVYLWMHTDTMLNYWNLPALALEYGLGERCFIDSRQMSDRELAMRYSGCDVTVLISGGEGFGYPIAESLSCGCPVVTGEYGAGMELAGRGVAPVYLMVDTSHNVRRAYYQPGSVAAVLDAVTGGEDPGENNRERVEHLEWKKLKGPWEKWVRRGLGVSSQ